MAACHYWTECARHGTSITEMYHRSLQFDFRQFRFGRFGGIWRNLRPASASANCRAPEVSNESRSGYAPDFRTPYSTNLHPAALPSSLAENYLAAAHNNRMGCLHAREPAAPNLPRNPTADADPHPPLYPMGVCFQPSAGSPTVQNQQLTERVHRSDKQNVVVFRSVFGPIRGYFAPFLAFFAGLRRAICGGTTPSRSTIIARRQREQQRGSGLDYPSWLIFTCNAA
jgi:hypothetical protein